MKAIENIKYTIVTVCYNEQDKIGRTIESVIQQTYSNLEYLIIDGASNDGTLEIIHRYARKDKRIKVISGPDDGIYNAMNKSISLAKGDYINFMNAGDSFMEVRTLDIISKMLRKGCPDILCGRLIYSGSNAPYKALSGFEKGKKSNGILEIRLTSKLSFKQLLLGRWAGHQAVFAKKSTLRQYYFNEKYIIAADYEWFIRNVRDGRDIEYINIIVCHFDSSGISSRSENSAILEKEIDDIIKRHFGILMFYIRRLLKP